jgi:hypothetical protein
MRPPVVRGLLFRSDLVEVRDNRCGRSEPSITPATERMRAAKK